MKLQYRNVHRFLTSICLIGSVLLFDACSKSDQEPSRRSRIDAQTLPSSSPTQPLTVGALLPLTGGTAFLGEMCKNAMDLAAKDINSAGGIRGCPLVIEYADNKNDPSEGVTLFNKMRMDGRQVIVSTMSSVTQAIKPLLDTNSPLVFATMVSTYGITRDCPFLFRLFVNAETDAGTMAQFASEKLGASKVAILAVNDEMGKSFAHVFSRRFEKGRGTISTLEFFNKETRDFREIILGIQRHEFDAVYVLGYEANLGSLIAQLRQAGVQQPILSIGTIAQENVLKLAGDAAIGVYYTSVEFDANAPSTDQPARAAAFTDAYLDTYKKRPTYFSVFAYDTIHMIAKAMIDSGHRAADVRRALQTSDPYDGVVGTISFDEHGDAVFPMTVRQLSAANLQK